MRHSPRFLNYTTDRVRRHQRPKVAEESITPTWSDQTNAVVVAAALPNIRQRLRGPGSRPTSQRQWAARIRREAGKSRCVTLDRERLCPL